LTEAARLGDLDQDGRAQEEVAAGTFLKDVVLILDDLLMKGRGCTILT
jgi:hypothetical protein